MGIAALGGGISWSTEQGDNDPEHQFLPDFDREYNKCTWISYHLGLGFGTTVAQYIKGEAYPMNDEKPLLKVLSK